MVLESITNYYLRITKLREMRGFLARGLMVLHCSGMGLSFLVLLAETSRAIWAERIYAISVSYIGIYVFHFRF